MSSVDCCTALQLVRDRAAMSRKDSQSDAASSVGDHSDAGSDKGGSGGGSQGDAAEFLKENKFSIKVRGKCDCVCDSVPGSSLQPLPPDHWHMISLIPCRQRCLESCTRCENYR